MQIFINRAELLDKEETTAEHLTYQRAETERIESDRKNKDLVSGGLFQGCFRHARAPGVPIRDLADGVERCPWCTWELEGGECTRCGFARDELDHFDRQAALMELLHGDGPEPGFDSEDFGMGDYEYDYDTDDIPGMPARVRLSSQTQTDSENEDSEDDSDEDDMGSFIDDDENGDSSSTEGHGTVSSTLAGNQNSELFAVSSDGPSQIADSMSEGTSLHSFGDMSRNPTIIELDDDDGEDEDDVGEGDDDHDDDEPIMTAAMATRRRRQISSSSSFASDTSVPRSQPNDGSASDNSDSDEPRGPVRRTRRGVTATS